MSDTATNPQTVIVNLPLFPGFYESILSGAIDYALEQQAENEKERESDKKWYPETYWPETLQLDHSDLWEHMNYSAAYAEMAKDYCESFDQWMNHNLETPLNSFAFESMSRPREYNFTTDRVFVTVPLSVMESLYQLVKGEPLAKVILESFTSRDGFISFYSNDLEDWQEKIESEGLASLDYNELGTILSAAITLHVAGENPQDWQWELCESIFESDYMYVDSHMDWQGYETACQQGRTDKLAKLICEDPDSAARLIAGCERVAALESLALESDEMDSDCLEAWQGKQETRAYRCPLTKDMFSGESA